MELHLFLITFCSNYIFLRIIKESFLTRIMTLTGHNSNLRINSNFGFAIWNWAKNTMHGDVSSQCRVTPVTLRGLVVLPHPSRSENSDAHISRAYTRISSRHMCTYQHFSFLLWLHLIQIILFSLTRDTRVIILENFFLFHPKNGFTSMNCRMLIVSTDKKFLYKAHIVQPISLSLLSSSSQSWTNSKYK